MPWEVCYKRHGCPVGWKCPGTRPWLIGPSVRRPVGPSVDGRVVLREGPSLKNMTGGAMAIL